MSSRHDARNVNIARYSNHAHAASDDPSHCTCSMARHQPRSVAHAFMLVCFWALVSWVDARAASGVDCKGLRDVALVEDSTSGTVTLSNGPVLLACTRARRAVLFAKHVKTTTSDLTWLAVGVRWQGLRASCLICTPGRSPSCAATFWVLAPSLVARTSSRPPSPVAPAVCHSRCRWRTRRQPQRLQGASTA